MATNYRWTEQIDRTLKHLYEEKKIICWTIIAEKLNEIYEGPERSAKQCRERFINLIKLKESSSSWTPEQAQTLKKEFLQKGPKWPNISLSIKEKSQNAIKNKFNADLRKALRRLNKVSRELKLKQRKPLCTDWFRRLTKAVFEEQEANTKKAQASELMKKIVEIMFKSEQKETAIVCRTMDQELIETICNYNVRFLFLKGKASPVESAEEKQEPTLSNSEGERIINISSLQVQNMVEQAHDENSLCMPSENVMELMENSQLEQPIDFMDFDLLSFEGIQKEINSSFDFLE